MAWLSELIGTTALSHRGNSAEASKVVKSVMNSKQMEEKSKTLTGLVSSIVMRRENTRTEAAEETEEGSEEEEAMATEVAMAIEVAMVIEVAMAIEEDIVAEEATTEVAMAI